MEVFRHAEATILTRHREREVQFRPFWYLFLLAMLAGCTQPDPPTIPFYPALRNGDLDQIHRHVIHGADLNALAPDGRRPLHIATESGRWVVAEMLLGHL